MATRWDTLTSKTSKTLTVTEGGTRIECAGTPYTNNAKSIHRIDGKVYVEFQCKAIDINIGLGLVIEGYDPETYMGQSGSMGYSPIDGKVYTNGDGGVASGLATPTTTDRICAAIDLPGNRVHYRINNGAWHNSGNPAAGTGGTAFTFGNYNYYIGAQAGVSTSSVSMYTDPQDWLYTPPAYFGEINAPQWDPTSVDTSYIRLNQNTSNYGITATFLGGGTDANFVSNIPIRGKRYFEVLNEGSGYWKVGIAWGGLAATGNPMGLWYGAALYASDANSWWTQGSSLGPVNLLGYDSGDRICIAVDADAKQIWARIGPTGNWNNYSDGNPFNGLRGVKWTDSPSIIGDDIVYAAGSVYGASNAHYLTGCFKPESWAGTPPQGFLPISNDYARFNRYDEDFQAQLVYEDNYGDLKINGVGASFNNSGVRTNYSFGGNDKVYAEFGIEDGNSSPIYQMVAVVNKNYNLDSYPNSPGSTDAFGIQQNNSRPAWQWTEDWSNNFNYVDASPGAQALRIAVDYPAKKLWFTAYANNTWLPSGDPALGTGGYDVSSITGDEWYFATFMPSAGGNWVRGRFDRGEWTASPPAGFRSLTELRSVSLPKFPASTILEGNVSLSSFTPWDANSVTITSNLLDVNGTYNATRIVANTTTGMLAFSVQRGGSTTLSNTNVYTVSVKARPYGVGSSFVRFNMYDSVGDWGCMFDLANGVVGSFRSGGVTELRSGIIPLTDGWYQCWMSIQGHNGTLNGTSGWQIGIAATDATNFDTNQTLTVGSGAEFCDWQLVAGNDPNGPQNIIKPKRTTTAGRVANTITLREAGGIVINTADQIAWSTDGNTVFEVGSNVTTSRVTGTLTIGNSTVNTAINATAIKLANSTANVTITAPNTAMVSNGQYMFNANGQWAIPAYTPIIGGNTSTNNVLYNLAGAVYGTEIMYQLNGFGGMYIYGSGLHLDNVTDGTVPSNGSILFSANSVGKSTLYANTTNQYSPFELQKMLCDRRFVYDQIVNNTTTRQLIGVASTNTATGVVSHNLTKVNNAAQQRSYSLIANSTTANQTSWVAHSTAHLFLGNAEKKGGFYINTRAGLSNRKSTAGNGVIFIGLQEAATSNLFSPTALRNCIGLAQSESISVNWMIVTANSTAANTIDLGSGFPANTSGTANTGAMYDMEFYVKPNSTTIYYKVTNTNDGNVATGICNATCIPAVNTLLTWKAYVNQDTIATNYGPRICFVYIETEF